MSAPSPTKGDPSISSSTAASTASTASTPEAAVAEPPSSSAGARRFLTSNIDTTQTLYPLLGYCFLTGFTSAPTFLACYLWCGFQTGGLVQLSLALARSFSTGNHTFHKPDQQALTSLLSFLLGTSLGRIGDKYGPKRRSWIMVATFIMALLALAAALCAKYCGEESVAQYRLESSWHSATGMAALAFASASLGLQGIVAKRLNTAFTTTVVLTTTWVDLINDPLLFARRAVNSRDYRALSILATFLGGMSSGGIVFASSSTVAFGVCAGLRLISMLSWLIVPMEKVK